MKEVQQEITFLSQLAQADAQNVTKYYGSFLNGSKLWIIMDYCSGGSLSTLIKAGTVEEKYSAVVMRELLVALVYIHKEGIIHRDIKAANVLVTKTGRVQLCDFGVAAQLSTAQVRRTSMIGTPYWMAPEVIQEGAMYNQKADIWSLGVTLYEITTGSPPYSDQEAQRAMQLIPRSKPARLEGTQYSAALKEFVAQCLDEQLEERASADELSKTRFIKNVKSVATYIIRDLIVRYAQWRAKNTAARNSLLAPGHGAASFTSDDEDDNGESQDFWDFDDSSPPRFANPFPAPTPLTGNDFMPSEPFIPGSQVGTMVLRGSTAISTLPDSGHKNDGLQTQAVTFKPEHAILAQNTTQPNTLTIPMEKHPLMELFETDEATVETPTTSSMPFPMSSNVVPLTNIMSSGIMPDNALATQLNISAAQPFTPSVEIEIPSLDALQIHSLTTPSAIAGVPYPSNTGPTSVVSTDFQDQGFSKSRPVMPVPTPVTPHTPIRTVFSQTNLQNMGSGQPSNGHISQVAPTVFKNSSLNTTLKTVRSTPNVLGVYDLTASNGIRIPSNGSPRPTLTSLERTPDAETKRSPSFSVTANEKLSLLPLGREGSHVSLESLALLKQNSADVSFKSLSSIRKLSASAGSTVTDQKVYVAPHSHLSIGMQPITLQPPPKFIDTKSGYTRDFSKDNSIMQLQNQHYKQQMVQHQTQSPTMLDKFPSPSRTMGSLQQFIPKQVLKQKPLKRIGLDQSKSQVTAGSSNGGFTETSLPRKFPQLAALDSNLLLDATSREETVANLDRLLASFMVGLDIIEQDLRTYI